jgi:hypothetical protein
MLAPADTLKSEKIKSTVLLWWFSGPLHTLEHSRTDRIKCIVSQLVEAYARGERALAAAG